ncbi:MAG: hypothetical protein HQL21_02225 [Candidatus Omnitrophica bacterium]|nr:hypothetical protein [Candidatus Omnitrophota bacterium]
MKRISFIFIGVIGFAGILFAQEREALVASSLVETKQVAPLEQPAFQWQDSLGGIRKTVAELLETNQKLAQEYTALNDGAARLQDQIAQKKEQDKTLQDSMVAIRMELLAPVKNTGPAQHELFLTQKVLAQEKQAVSVLNVKRKSLESRLALLQLKVKGLELDKRAIFVDKKAPKEEVPFDGTTELNRLKASLESLKRQEEGFQEKIADARSKTPIPTEEDAKIIREMGELKADLVILQQEKTDLNRRIKERSALMNSLSFRRYQELVARKEALTKKAENLKKPKEAPEIKVAQVSVAVPSRDWQADIKGVNDENTRFDEQIGDLRENIAVLEYKINNLEHYRDRNKSGI